MCCDRPPKCEAVCQSGSDLDGNMSTLDAQSSGPAFHRHNINTGTRTEAIANNNIFLLLSLRAIEAGEGGGGGGNGFNSETNHFIYRSFYHFPIVSSRWRYSIARFLEFIG